MSSFTLSPADRLGYSDSNHLRQLIGVVRHAERADAACSTDCWCHSTDFLRFPADPPLSEHGFGEAEAIGRMVREWVKKRKGHMHNIICSPYFRCVQTAALICRELGPTTRLIIDFHLAEVQSPDILGEQMQACTTRPFEDIHAYCKAQGVHSITAPIGKWPKWPEGVRSARKRFAQRFLKYLHWGIKSQQNWIFVSHSECVRATLSLMPSHGNSSHSVLKVDFGGCFLASREPREESADDDDDNDYDGDDGDFLDGDAVAERQISTMSSYSQFSEISFGAFSRQVSSEHVERTIPGVHNGADDETARIRESSDSSDNAELAPSGCWRVWVHNIKSTSNSKTALEKKLETLAHTGPYNRKQLAHLLGESATKEQLKIFSEELSDKQLEQLGDFAGGVQDSCFGVSEGPIESHAELNSITASLGANSKSGYASEMSFASSGPDGMSLVDDSRPSLLSRMWLPVEATHTQEQHTVIEKKPVMLDRVPNADLLRRRRSLGSSKESSDSQSPTGRSFDSP